MGRPLLSSVNGVIDLASDRPGWALASGAAAAFVLHRGVEESRLSADTNQRAEILEVSLAMDKAAHQGTVPEQQE